MPPYSDLISAVDFTNLHILESDTVKINVGGQLFQTTRETLSIAGNTSPLLSSSFFDRDPSLFSVFLSKLRQPSISLPSNDPFFLEDLYNESKFYNLQSIFETKKDSTFNALSLSPSLNLPLPGRNNPSAIAVTEDNVHVSHGGLITTFSSFEFCRRSTALTPLPAIDHILELSPLTVAVAACDFPSLHILDLSNDGNGVRDKGVKRTLSWSPPPPAPPTPSTVQAIESSSEYLFASFESCRRNANAILAFDLADGLMRPAFEIAKQEIFGAEIESAIPATKLDWVPGMNLLMTAGSHGGPSGLLGNLRLWDIRSGKAVWELVERVDCFADVTVCDELSAMFKVGMHSGEVFMADLRKLGAGEMNWVCLGDERKVMNGRKEGSGSKIESCGRQVLCTKGGDVEVWSDVLFSDHNNDGERVMRRNSLGRAKDAGRGKINKIAVGGGRMAVARKDEQSVEVWESSIKG